MPLTQAQKTTLKNDIAANANTVTYNGQSVAISTLPNDPDANTAIAAWYNLPTSPAFYAWHFSRSGMDQRRAVKNTSGAGAQLDALTGSKREALLWGLSETTDCKLAAARACIEDWCGSQNTLKAALVDSFKRLLTAAEKLFVVAGGGSGAFATPADGGFEGALTFSDVQQARDQG